MERQMSQTSQWSKTCIGEGAYRWKDKCKWTKICISEGGVGWKKRVQQSCQWNNTFQWNNTCIREGAYGWKNEWSSQVSGQRLVKGREITDRKTSVADKWKDENLYQGGRFRLEKRVKQSRQWNNTCIREGAYRWKDKCLRQVTGLRLVSGMRLVSGREV